MNICIERERSERYSNYMHTGEATWMRYDNYVHMNYAIICI